MQQRPGGSWNPEGDSYWRLMGCRVTGAYGPDGAPAAENDPVRACLLADSDRETAGKLVDLDPQQQLVSQIWGMDVRVTTADGATLLRGRFEPAALTDLWDRWPGAAGDVPAGAMYQSVLTGLEWGAVDGSPVLAALRAAGQASGRLSIKFNVDMIDLNPNSPTFLQGRLAGTIGPSPAGEPKHLQLGRQFMTMQGPGGSFYTPAGRINWCPAVVDEARGKVLLDLGNALPNAPASAGKPRGSVADLGELSLACLVPGGSGVQRVPLGVIEYRQPGWYEQTAGIVEVPAERPLTADELATVRDNPLALLIPDPAQPDARVVAIAESPTGLFARADQFVFRLEAEEHGQAEVWATRFGKPLAGAEVLPLRYPWGLQSSPVNPPVATPEEGLTFPDSVTTGPDGRAVVPLIAGDPGHARGYIDGQVYGVLPILASVVEDHDYPVSPWHFISVLVWDHFTVSEPPTWYGGLQPVFQQYYNLYPVMKRFLDLSSYESVCANRNLLLLAFGLDPSNPNYMPVIRDLSAARRNVILRWLSEVGPDGKPLLGTPPAGAAAAAADDAAAQPGVPVTSAVHQDEELDPGPESHGKVNAVARRLSRGTHYPLKSEQP
jgi:hypothetical protein